VGVANDFMLSACISESAQQILLRQ